MPSDTDITNLGIDADFYRLACEHAGVALIATDNRLAIRTWNSAAGRLFGASAQQMVGASILTIVPAEDRNRAEVALLGATEKREISEFEFKQRDGQGNQIRLAVAIAPIVDDEGATLGASVWVRDISRRTKLADQLAHNKKMTSLGEMAGALAHHFNNILGGLVTSVDFALASGDPAIERRALNQASIGMSRATHLVDSLLAFAEGDHRSNDLCDLTEVILEAIDVLTPEALAAHCTLETNIESIPVIAVPREQMRTVVFNLVHNAVDAMPGGGNICIDLSDHKTECVLRISDTGCGVSAEHLPRLFEPFFSTKRDARPPDHHAIGLGLAVAHGFVAELGGTIHVASEIGKGSHFEVHIPYPAHNDATALASVAEADPD